MGDRTSKTGVSVRWAGTAIAVSGFTLLITISLYGAVYGSVSAADPAVGVTAIDRADHLVENWGPLGILATILTWIVLPIAYDLLTRRAIHWASIAGIVFSIATFAFMLVIVFSPFMGVIEAWFFS